MATIDSIVYAEMAALEAEHGITLALRAALAQLRRDVNQVTALCVTAGLAVEGPDVRPVLQALVDAKIAELFSAEGE